MQRGTVDFYLCFRIFNLWMERLWISSLWKLKICSKPFHNDVRKRRCWLERTIPWVKKKFLARKFPRENESRSGAFDVLLMEIKCNIPGADPILAQPLKRCSASRIKPNETFEVAKKRWNILCFGVCGCVDVWVCRCVGVWRKKFLYVVVKLQAKFQKPWKSPCPTVLQLRWVISTWWDENMTLFVFSACYEIH